jgi:hypothetical protein
MIVPRLREYLMAMGLIGLVGTTGFEAQFPGNLRAVKPKDLPARGREIFVIRLSEPVGDLLATLGRR